MIMLEGFKQRIHYARKLWLLQLARRLGGPRFVLALARLFYRLRIDGEANIPAQGGCLVAFNHVSTIADALLFLVVQRRRPDANLFVQGLTGEVIAGLLEALGLWQGQERMLLTDNRRTLAAAGLLHARQVLLDGGCVVIAPEGEFTWDGRLQSPLAAGAAWLALRSGSPLIPVVSQGGYDIQPVWQMEKTRLTGQIHICAGQPLVLGAQSLERVTDAHIQAANQRLWQALAALLES